MTRPRQKNRELLDALCAAGFEFVVVGGVAAVLHGSARLTVDLDVAAPFTAENLERLFDAFGLTVPCTQRDPTFPCSMSRSSA